MKPSLANIAIFSTFFGSFVACGVQSHNQHNGASTASTYHLHVQSVDTASGLNDEAMRTLADLDNAEVPEDCQRKVAAAVLKALQSLFEFDRSELDSVRFQSFESLESETPGSLARVDAYLVSAQDPRGETSWLAVAAAEDCRVLSVHLADDQ